MAIPSVTLLKSLSLRFSLLALSSRACLFLSFRLCLVNLKEHVLSQQEVELNLCLSKKRLLAMPAASKQDVILDLSFAFRETRDLYRTLIVSNGGEPLLVFMSCLDEDVLWDRIRKRQEAGVNADANFKISRQTLRLYLGGFEVPNGEGEIVVGGW